MILERVVLGYNVTVKVNAGDMEMGAVQSKGLYWSLFLGLQVTETTPQSSLSRKGTLSVCVTEELGGCRGRQRAVSRVKRPRTVMKSEEWK